MTYSKKQGAILGIIGLLFFFIGFIILPDALLRGMNVFVLLGFGFLAISIAQPLFPRVLKVFGRA